MKLYRKIKITGSKKFVNQTVKALKLIKIKSQKDFVKINRFLKKIKSSKSSGMILDKAQFNVGKLTAFSSLEWYASCIVHDVHHYYLHHIIKFRWKKGNYTKHERLCTNEQLRFLRKIKADKKLIKHCQDIFKIKYWTKKVWW